MANIYAAFGKIDLDPCGHRLSPVVARRRILLDEGGDGLVDDWSGTTAFVNPPFSELLKWLRRACLQWQAGRLETVICLVPVRTDSAWFDDARGKGQHTPFSLTILTLGASAERKTRLSAQVPGFWPVRSDVASEG